MTAQLIYSEYYYRIQDLETGKYYSGAKWGKDAYPDLFWKEGGYFTTSKTVLDLVEKYGKNRFKVCKIIPMKNSYSYETRFLQRVDAMNHEMFYNKHNNHGIQNLVENNKKLLKEGKHPFQTNNPSTRMSEEGTHHFYGGAIQGVTSRRRVEEGTHNLLTLSTKRIDEGTHHFLDKDWQKENNPYIVNNPSKIKYKCTITGIISHKGGFKRRARNKGLDEWPHPLERITL